MKTQYVMGMVAAVIMGASASSAFALATVQVNGGAFQNGSGGEFTITPNATALSGSGTPDLTDYLNSYNALAKVGNGFQSFCLELHSEVSFGGVYQYGVNVGAIGGGVGAVGGMDVISVGTAWLYSQFATGTLAGYFSPNAAVRNANAGLLQEAIWYLEKEVNTISGSNPFYLAAVSQFGAYVDLDQAANGDTAADYGVFALNLGDPNGALPYNNQDQLIYRHVPETGSTLALMSLAMGGLALVRRKRA